MTMATKEPKPEEGTRSFARFIEMLDTGQAQLVASEKLHQLAVKMRDEALAQHRSVTGSITLTINLSCDETGTVDAKYNVKSKEPTPRSSKSIFWMTKGGNLTVENPRQQTLGLREVKGDADVRNIDGEKPAVREV